MTHRTLKQKHDKPFIEKIVIDHEYDEYADLSYLEQEYDDVSEKEREKYKQQDKNRLDEFNSGYWYPMGIIAKTDILVPEGEGNYRIVPITSGGIWGIESDSDDRYIEEEEDQQIEDLKQLLKVFNVQVPKDIEIRRSEN